MITEPTESISKVNSRTLCNRKYIDKLDGIPETLKQYFYETDDDFDNLTDEDLSEAKAEYGRS